MAPAQRSQTTAPPAMSTYLDAVAALVPAEVLGVHALFISKFTTTSNNNKDKTAVTTIIDPTALKWAFIVLLVASVGLYVLGRTGRGWDKWDFVRAAIPPLALLAWMMLQRSTAFDAFKPDADEGLRFVFGIALALLLGAIAKLLGDTADNRVPPANGAPPPAPAV